MVSNFSCEKPKTKVLSLQQFAFSATGSASLLQQLTAYFAV
jgi:hypothetical protein